MSLLTEYRVAKATAAQYLRETAKAQVTLDELLVDNDDSDDTLKNARSRLAFYKAKAREWGDKADAAILKREAASK
jgi:hypothetical protein